MGEVTEYEMVISINETFWRIFGFLIHERHRIIQQFSVHLENGQRVYFTAETAVQQALAPRDTTLTAFSKLCEQDQLDTILLYHQVPSYYTWKNRTWNRIKRGAQVVGNPHIRFDKTIEIIYAVHPKQQDCFFL